jgi:Family of unknown function (DUF6535)
VPAITSTSPAPFRVSPTAFRVNTFWFLSLAFSISCALGATLVQQWARHYQLSVEGHSIPHKRARIRAYLKEGVDKFGVTALVNGIPVLLHISVFFFMLGLFEYLLSINPAIAFLTFGTVGVFLSFYGIFTLLPLVYKNCPYRTPLSVVCWRVFQTLHLLRYRNDRGRSTPIRHGLSGYRVHIATKPSRARRMRDERALHGLLESFAKDGDFEGFIAGIPDFLSSTDDNPGIAFWERFQAEDIALCTRITNLLVTCQRGGVLSETARQRRAQLCLNAICSMTQSSLSTSQQPSENKTIAPRISAWAIGQDNVTAIAALKSDNAPSVAIHVSCAIAVVSCKIVENWSTGPIKLVETLKMLELLDIYKYLPQEQQLALLQQRMEESERPDHAMELKQNPELGQTLTKELEMLKQDAYFGVLIAFIHSVSTLKHLSTHSGLPLAVKTLDLIISLFPSVTPTLYTQHLMVRCLRRAVNCDERQIHIRSATDPSDAPNVIRPPERRQTSLSFDTTTQQELPPPLVDHFLPGVVRALEERASLEKARAILRAYQKKRQQSATVEKMLMILEAKLTRSRSNSSSEPATITLSPYLIPSDLPV